MKMLFTALAVACTLAASAGAQPVADHLKCFKVKDPQTRTTYTADLGGLTMETGCKVKVPATMACVPASKENVQPPPPGGGGTGAAGAFGCYKVRCPKGSPLPTLQLTDQFGSRVVAPKVSKLICAPALSAGCTQPFDPSVAQIANAITLQLDASGNADVPPSCGTSPAICCPGGVAATPCGPLHEDLVSVTLVPAVGNPDLYDASARMQVRTVADIPISVPAVGDCGLHIDTSPGPSPTIQIDVPLLLSPDRLRITQVLGATLTDLTADDVSLTGGIGCAIANPGLDFFVGALTDVLSNELLRLEDVCRRCGSNDVTDCSP